MSDQITAREFDTAISAVRDSIDALARLYADGAERATAEHAEVRAELRANRAEVAQLRRQVDTAVVPADAHAELKQYLYGRLDRLEAELATRMRRPSVGQLVAIGGLAVALAGFLVGVL